MFDRKAGNDIALEFFRIMGEDTFKKEASDLQEKEASDNPESYLIAPEEGADGAEQVNSALESKIAEVDSYAEDAENAQEAGSDDAKDVSYLLDSSAQELLEGLGKIASNLRDKNEGLAADMVEVTANNIQEDLLKKASEKLFVLDSLTKMASDLDNEGDVLAADMVKVTIEKIKNS